MRHRLVWVAWISESCYLVRGRLRETHQERGKRLHVAALMHSAVVARRGRMVWSSHYQQLLTAASSRPSSPGYFYLWDHSLGKSLSSRNNLDWGVSQGCERR